jgi:hypothetical protein
VKFADLSFGLNAQALAVAHLLAEREIKQGNYVLGTSTWYNGRERGILFSANPWQGKPVLHIAVFEHRNSDKLCALKWHQPLTINPPTIDDPQVAILAYPNDSSQDVAFEVPYGQIGEMAKWVYAQVEEYLTEMEVW